MKQTIATLADKDTDSDTETDTKQIPENGIDGRKLKFAQSLIPFVDQYGKDMIRKFCDYWSEPNQSNSKFRKELEKTWDMKRRLETWSENDKTFSPKTKTVATDGPKLKEWKPREE